MTHKILCSIAALIVLLGHGKAALAETSTCDDLRKQAKATLLIDSTENVPAGTQRKVDPTRGALSGLAKSQTTLPEHCLVRGTLEPRTGAGGVSFGIGFELRMPLQWNGKFLYQGGGGLDGVINEAVGITSTLGSTATPALNRGYAVVSTDSGHKAKTLIDASFGLDQQARLDLAYAAIGKVTAVAKQLIDAYYKRAPEHSYFMGCSNGGREALMAAERFPLEFDGIVAGDPGIRMSRAVIGQMWDDAAFLKAAPEGEDGKPILANALTRADMQLVSQKILERCDALDGAKDGSIDAMSACHFDVTELQCRRDITKGCLAAPQIEALKTVFAGAHDSKGNALYASWPWDAGIDAIGWRLWKLGTSQSSEPDALNVASSASLGLYFMTPPDPSIQPQTVDFDTIAGQVAQTGAINDAIFPMLSTVASRHGKILVFQGNSDPVFSANDLRDWWQQLASTNGGADGLSQTARLFIVPGMTHCGGGPALDNFDPLTAVEHWVEQDEAPETLSATGRSFPGRQRNLCPYPKEAHYVGSGDVNAASSFRCVVPSSQ